MKVAKAGKSWSSLPGKLGLSLVPNLSHLPSPPNKGPWIDSHSFSPTLISKTSPSSNPGESLEEEGSDEKELKVTKNSMLMHSFKYYDIATECQILSTTDSMAM
jgi:hypothetical protein